MIAGEVQVHTGGDGAESQQDSACDKRGPSIPRYYLNCKVAVRAPEIPNDVHLDTVKVYARATIVATGSSGCLLGEQVC